MADSEPPKRTGWEDLPNELKSAILQQMGDLGSLGGILHASPTTYRTFGNAVPYLAEVILKTGYVCGHTAVLFRICALIRSGKLPVDSVEEFGKRVTKEALRPDGRIRETNVGIAPRNLHRDVDPAIVRGLLATARQASNLAIECLDFYLGRFAALRPQHPLQRKFKAYTKVKGTWQSRPSGNPVKARVCESISWAEEQRAVRSVWRLQLIYDLKRAVRKKVLRWTDAAQLESTKALGPPSDGPLQAPPSFYGSHKNYEKFLNPVMDLWERMGYSLTTDGPEYEQINSMVAFVHERYGEHSAEHMRDGHLCLSDL
ncbi:hypothetical protein K4F52_000211 [Lecanicillium sp. MT-2017a]|nr:hypothetical protein K4F52_000211 [Lecanicillium sp. MT-2017a]